MRPASESIPFDAPVISVTELNRSVRDLLERRFPLGWIAGEISNFKRYDSGHCYFTLKDAGAQVRCVMFRGRARAHTGAFCREHCVKRGAPAAYCRFRPYTAAIEFQR